MTTSSQPLVSIVTPVYNGAEHLAECIESVLAQTYQNWDYTIVNNCSTDGTEEIARAYAAKDSRIRVCNNATFLRAIANHNLALQQISPDCKYAKVVFGDDWIFPECLERMVGLAEENPSVSIVGAYAMEGSNIAWTGLPYSSRCVPGREVCRQHFLNGVFVFGTATSVLYRSDKVRSIRPFYNEANIHADTEVCFAMLRDSNFGFVHQVLSYTRLRPGSLNTVSADLNAHFGAMLHNLKTYGPDFLSNDELQACLKTNISEYYRFLGRSVLLGRGKQFWDFHRGKLKDAGYEFNRGRVAWGTFATLLDAALRPKDVLRKMTELGDTGAVNTPPAAGADTLGQPAKEMR